MSYMFLFVIREQLLYLDYEKGLESFETNTLLGFPSTNLVPNIKS